VCSAGRCDHAFVPAALGLGYDREANLEPCPFLLPDLFQVSPNLLDEPPDEISSRAAFAGWSHTTSIITDAQHALALWLDRKGDPNDTDRPLWISVFQRVRDEFVDDQAEGNGPLVGQAKCGKVRLDLNAFARLPQSARK
jgi:hypothetical protein